MYKRQDPFPGFGAVLIDEIDFVDGSPFDQTTMNTEVETVTISDIPPGTTLTYFNGFTTVPFTASPGSDTIVLSDTTGTPVGDQVATLSIQAPPESDGDFVLNVTLDSTQDILDDEGSFPFVVEVLATADQPAITAEPIEVTENDGVNPPSDVPLNVTFDASVDDFDLSEDLSVIFEVPDSVASGAPIGELDVDTSSFPPNTFLVVEDDVNGIYTIEFDGTNPCLLYTSPSPRD